MAFSVCLKDVTDPMIHSKSAAPEVNHGLDGLRQVLLCGLVQGDAPPAVQRVDVQVRPGQDLPEQLGVSSLEDDLQQRGSGITQVDICSRMAQEGFGSLGILLEKVI